jgi:hypothetical protein
MSEVTGTFQKDTHDTTIVERAFRCDNCERLSLYSLVEPRGMSAGVRSLLRREEWLPRHLERRDFPDVPDNVAAAAGEATLCHSVGAYRAVGSLARAVIEATAKDKGAAGRSLADRIDALHSLGHIRHHTREQAHEIRYFGNDMAHGDFTDPATEEEAAEVIELMDEVLREVYQSPARLARVKAARIAKHHEQ